MILCFGFTAPQNHSRAVALESLSNRWLAAKCASKHLIRNLDGASSTKARSLRGACRRHWATKSGAIPLEQLWLLLLARTWHGVVDCWMRRERGCVPQCPCRLLPLKPGRPHFRRSLGRGFAKYQYFVTFFSCRVAMRRSCWELLADSELLRQAGRRRERAGLDGSWRGQGLPSLGRPRCGASAANWETTRQGPTQQATVPFGRHCDWLSRKTTKQGTEGLSSASCRITGLVKDLEMT